MTEDVTHTLDPRTVTLWRVTGFVRLVALWIPVAVALGVVLALRWNAALGWGVACMVVAFNLALTLVWPPLVWRHYRYTLRAADLLVERGVFFQQTVSVPRDRIQYVDTRQGPVDRAFGLSELMVFTAAGLSADASLPGLDEAEAARLRDALGHRGADDGV